MLVLGLDFESTGVDVKTARVIEIGAVLWETDLKMPVAMLSDFVYADDYDAEAIKKSGDESHGIPLEVLQQRGIEPRTAFSLLLSFMEQAQYVVGHNVREYDFPLLSEELGRAGLAVPKCKLIDTMGDLPFPKNIKGRGLEYLSAKHGFVNPFPHRAVTDVLSTLKLFSMYEFSEVEKIAKAPNITIRAKVSFDHKEKAKARGYRWDGDKKIWVKTIKDFQLEEEKKADFEVIVLGAK
jgi:DNA polymerase-3 subunit epsilon